MTAPLGKLLVVDDNDMNRDMLSRRLVRRGYIVETVSDGQLALEAIANGKFDLILLDIMMPGLSGWTVLERIREEYSRLELPVIMATSNHQSEDVVRALQAGANDYVTKPFDFEVVLARVGTHVILKLTHAQLTAANRKLKEDLASAAGVQRIYLPPRSPELRGCEVAWRYEPCEELGGDFLNVFELGENQIGLYMLDVSGHGVPAALMSVAVSRALAPNPSDTCVVCRPDHPPNSDQLLVTPPSIVADKLNRQFPMNPRGSQYFTLIYGVLDCATGTFRYTSGGHPPNAYVPVGETPRLVRFSGGPPIGMFQADDGLFGPYLQSEIQLRQGDRLYLYSDGIIEAANVEKELFGSDRLLSHLGSQPGASLQETLDALWQALSAWGGPERGLQDDVSLLALQWNGPSAK